MLGGAAGAAGLAALGQGARGAWSAARQATPVALETGVSFVEPPVLRSVDGRLDVALEANFGPAILGGREVTTFTYNGMLPGPTLRLKAGETLHVKLTNLAHEATNLHTHGLHVSPSANSDNVLMATSLVRKALNVPGSAKGVLTECDRLLKRWT